MEIITIVLGANETKSFRKAGSSIEIIDSLYGVNIDFYGLNQGIKNTLNNGLSGLFMNVEFSAFDIENTSSSAQTVQLLVCDAGESGGSRRQPGNVRVIDEITDACTSFGFSPALGVSAVAWSVVVAPAANTKGIIVRGVNAVSQSGAGGTCNVGAEAAKATPTTYTNPAQRYTINTNYSQAGQFVQSFDPKFNKYIPPGWGLYVYSAQGVAAAQVLSLNLQYELLR